MALRKVVRIDEELCTGCGDCVPACAEGAIQIIDGKAKLIADKLCDGLGACLGDCPEGAISVEEREADEFDEAAVARHLKKIRRPGSAPPSGLPMADAAQAPAPGGCPGSRVLSFDGPMAAAADGQTAPPQPSALRQWPVQLHLVPPTAPFLQGADLLLAADCAPFAMPDFHTKQLSGKALAVACPKLDHDQEIYVEKLRAMIDEAQVNTITVLIMEVPCCSGLVMLAKQATMQAKRKVPVKVAVVGLQGEIIAEQWAEMGG